MDESLLELRDCTMRFGGLTAVSKVDFVMGPRELVGLIGPNGAGKTTLFNLVTGVYQPTEGEIFYSGKKVRNPRPFDITRLGVARTFQNIRLFTSMTVLDNVRSALRLHAPIGLFASWWRGPRFHRVEMDVEKEGLELLELFKLDGVADQLATHLSYGDQRRLEIIRALATRPKLLLLDEPAAGMNPTEKVGLMQLIRFIQERYQLAVLLVEHDMQVVMNVCQRIVVLDHGEKIAEGTPTEIRQNAKVIEAYLG